MLAKAQITLLTTSKLRQNPVGVILILTPNCGHQINTLEPDSGHWIGSSSWPSARRLVRDPAEAGSRSGRGWFYNLIGWTVGQSTKRLVLCPGWLEFFWQKRVDELVCSSAHWDICVSVVGSFVCLWLVVKQPECTILPPHRRPILIALVRYFTLFLLNQRHANP
jgi:hypothetical protein